MNGANGLVESATYRCETVAKPPPEIVPFAQAQLDGPHDPSRRDRKEAPDATFEAEFVEDFATQGMEAAIVHLSERHDLDEIEVLAVQATIAGLIPSRAQ